jgi:hypothetical protein
MTNMRNHLAGLIRKRRFGEPVVIVSGLPRSGTSMVMKMLEAGGFPILTDHARRADEDNPEGYFEYERVKDLAADTDKSWVREARGKALKVISHLVKELPPDNFYRVILARRDLKEVLASQNIMLARRLQPNPIEDAAAEELYRKHLLSVALHIQNSPNMELLTVRFHEIVRDPLGCARQISRFVPGSLDATTMAGVVNERLYRNRNPQPAT